MKRDRRGFALVFSVLMVLALAVMASGILAVGTREARIAAAVTRKAQAAYRAEAAALEVFGRWSTKAVADLPLGGERTVATGGTGRAATIERVDSALFLVRGTGRVPSPHGLTTHAVGLLVRVLHPDRLAASFPGALTATGPVTATGGVIAGAPGVPASCADPGPGVLAPTVAVGAEASVTGDPPVLVASPPTRAPQPFGAAAAEQVATLRHGGLTASPRPLAATGECVADARNWGSPDPAHPCHTLRPVILAGSLVLAGGVGRGVLIVDGDLTIADGARFHGIILVRGRLDLRNGTLRGAVRAGSAVVHEGTVSRDACALAAALSAPGLDRAFRPPGRWWVSAF